MADTNVNVTNTSPKLMAICMVLIMMNTCYSMINQELMLGNQKQQLDQAKKQYTLDSLRYEQMLQIQDVLERQHYTDSLLNIATRELGRDVRAKTKQSEKVLKFAEQNVKTR